MRLKSGRMAREVKRARGPAVWLAAAIIMAIASITVMAANLRLTAPWKHGYYARVALDDAKGVVSGGKQQVRLSGLNVGAIEDVQLLHGRPVATIKIEGEDGPLYRDARLRLRPKTPLDDLVLDIEDRGHPSAGKVGWQQLGFFGAFSGGPPKGDPILSSQRTTTPVDIGRVLNVFDVDTRSRLKTSIDELGKGLPDHGYQLRATLAQLAPFLSAAQRLSHETAVRRTQTRRLVHNFRLTTEELARRDVKLTQVVRGGAATLTEVADRDASVSDLLTQLPPTMRQLQSTFATVRGTADELDPAFDALQPTARALPAGLAGLRDFSVEARPALHALRAPLPQLTTLVRSLKPTSRGLQTSFTRLRPVTPDVDRITALIVPCEVALSKFFNNTISLGKFSDGRGSIFRGQTIDGNAKNQRALQSCAPGTPDGGKGNP